MFRRPLNPVSAVGSSGGERVSVERSGGEVLVLFASSGVEAPEEEGDSPRYVNWRETRKWMRAGVDGIPASR